MQRPVMNPTFACEAQEQPTRKLRPLAWLGPVFKLLARVLLASPFGKRRKFRNEEGSRAARFMRGLMYRLAFVPLILVIFLTALVFATTHPGRTDSGPDPLSLGVYYDLVNFVSDDGVRLDGWLIPVIDAKRVMEEKERVFNRRYPAVVLAHDFAASREQLLPLIQPLHSAGFVVLALNLRGAPSLSSDAQTFGIREAADIKGAVDMLRRRAYVDPAKVALVGIGSGANACLIAARNDPAINVMVVCAPVDGFDTAFANRIGSDRAWLPPLQPLLRWTFQMMYGVDSTDLELGNFAEMIASRHVLKTDARQGLVDPPAITGVQNFLQKHLGSQVAMASGGK